MSNKKQEVRLMFFSGFYESIHDSVFDMETEMIMEDYPGKKWDNFRWEYDWNQYARNYVSAISNELGIKFEFRNLWSPREYNFATDEIYCYISPKDVKKISSAIDSETLKKLVKSRFTSRDGFISFYSNSVEEWKEKPVTEWDEIELGTLLDAWIIENHFSELGDLNFVGYEYCQGNGQYVTYEKLWDEETDYYRCPECGETSYPEAYNTKDENPEERICNGCGMTFEMYEYKK